MKRRRASSEADDGASGSGSKPIKRARYESPELTVKLEHESTQTIPAMSEVNDAAISGPKVKTEDDLTREIQAEIDILEAARRKNNWEIDQKIRLLERRFKVSYIEIRSLRCKLLTPQINHRWAIETRSRFWFLAMNDLSDLVDVLYL